MSSNDFDPRKKPRHPPTGPKNILSLARSDPIFSSIVKKSKRSLKTRHHRSLSPPEHLAPKAEAPPPGPGPRLKGFSIPPELHGLVNRFVRHIHAADSKPLLIAGASGSGKSFFVNILEQYYHHIHPGHPVQVSRFDGRDMEPSSQSPGEIIKEFLTSAATLKSTPHRSSESLIICVVEHIDRLPDAMLDRLPSYLPSSPSTPRVKLVGTVSRSHVSLLQPIPGLNKNFYYRCIPFAIPPLHQRRRDILYHLSAGPAQAGLEYRTSVNNQIISPYQSGIPALALLCHHWPGNLWELEQIWCAIMANGPGQPQTPSNTKAQPPQTANSHWAVSRTIPWYFLHRQLLTDLQAAGIPVGTLHACLAQFGLGLQEDEQTIRASNRNTGDHPALVSRTQENELFGDASILKSKALDTIYKGFQCYCALFHLPVNAGVNLLNLNKAPIDPGFERLKQLTDNDGTLQKISERILAYRLNQQPKESKSPIASDSSPLNLDRQSIQKYLSQFTQEQVLDLYYQELFEQENGVQTAVAKRAEISDYTKRKRYRKYIEHQKSTVEISKK